MAAAKATTAPAAGKRRSEYDRRQANGRLTADQKRRVREMVEDEGHTRASALAWVQAFEAA